MITEEMIEVGYRASLFASKGEVRKILTAALSASPGGVVKRIEPTYTQDEYDEAYELGKRDGYSEAVQQIDQLTGGDGEYRYCSDHDPERHTPGPAEMIQRIVDRFETLNLIDDASKTGRDQEWGMSAIEPAGVGVETEDVARRIYEDEHKGMSNIWAWDDGGLDDEHPGARERYLGYASSAIAALTKGATND